MLLFRKKPEQNHLITMALHKKIKDTKQKLSTIGYETFKFAFKNTRIFMDFIYSLRINIKIRFKNFFKLKFLSLK